MLGVEKFTMSGSLLYRLNFKGMPGALALGLAYGILSARAPSALSRRFWPSSRYSKRWRPASCSSCSSPWVIACRSPLPAVPPPPYASWSKAAPGRGPAAGFANCRSGYLSARCVFHSQSLFWRSLLLKVNQTSAAPLQVRRSATGILSSIRQLSASGVARARLVMAGIFLYASIDKSPTRRRSPRIFTTTRSSRTR